MKSTRLYLLNIAISLLIGYSSAFAAEDYASGIAGASEGLESVELTEKEKFYGTALRADKKVVHPPYEWGDCTVCHEETDPENGENLKLDPPPPS